MPYIYSDTARKTSEYLSSYEEGFPNAEVFYVSQEDVASRSTVSGKPGNHIQLALLRRRTPTERYRYFGRSRGMERILSEHDGAVAEGGWYWWPCLQGNCIPDGDAIGPFATEAEATTDAQDIS